MYLKKISVQKPINFKYFILIFSAFKHWIIKFNCFYDIFAVFHTLKFYYVISSIVDLKNINTSNIFLSGREFMKWHSL